MSMRSVPVRSSVLPGQASPSNVRDHAVETSHGTIALRESLGSGTPVLFLHGNSSSKDVFDPQVSGSFGVNNRCIALDLPGHGASTAAPDAKRTYNIAGYADAVIEVLETLGIDDVVLVGWSLGGHVALEMMASFPGVVGAMISGTPPIGTGLRGLLRGFRFSAATPLLTAGRLSDGQMATLARVSVGAPHVDDAIAAIRRTDGRARDLLFRSLIGGSHADQRKTVETSDVPLAVVNGGNDPFLRAAYFRELRFANLWDGQCHVVAGAGHAPFLDAPAVFDLLLGRFARDMAERADHMRAHPRLVFSG